MIQKEDIDKLIYWVKSKGVDISKAPSEFGYENINLILIDAVLSINRRYNEFVVPRVNNFKKEHSDISTLEDLKKLIKEKGFTKVLKYNHQERENILLELINFFLDYKKEHSFFSDKESMIDWAKSRELLSVKGIGFKTTQYIRMMLGISTVKPDVNIHKAVFDALNKKVSDKDAVELIEKVALEMKIPATSLDHGIWKLYAKK